MAVKNSSQDFKIKKEFIDLQLELKKFMEETEVFALKDILKDSLLVHSIENYVDAYKEFEETKRIKKVLKRLLRLKKKNVNLGDILEKMEPTPKREEEDHKMHFSETDLKNNYFKLRQPAVVQKPSRDRMLQLFKSHMKKIEYFKKISIKSPVCTRNYTISSSHSHLIKKIEKSNDYGLTAQHPTGRMNNEITTNMSFRNGVLRNPSSQEKNVKTPNVVKANRSPVQASSDRNPHEALLSQQSQDNYSTQQPSDESPNDNPSK